VTTFLIIGGIALHIALAAWFGGTPSSRHPFGIEGKDPGQACAHARGSMLNADRDFRKND